MPPRDGFLFLDRDKFHASFAGDLPADVATFMADSQVPWGVNALTGVVTVPAWRTKPSWYLVATEDRMIIPVFLAVVAFVAPWLLGFTAVTAVAWAAWILGVLAVLNAGGTFLAAGRRTTTG